MNFKCNFSAIKNQFKKAKFFTKNNYGMTLVEIMIVLAIIGSIMALLLPRIGGAQDKAKVKEAKIQIGQLINAMTQYYSDCGKYPESIDGLLKQDPNCSNWGPEPYFKVQKGRTQILDPWGTPYEYTKSGGDFIIKSLGKGGAEGGDAYEADISSEDI